MQLLNKTSLLLPIKINLWLHQQICERHQTGASCKTISFRELWMYRKTIQAHFKTMSSSSRVKSRPESELSLIWLSSFPKCWWCKNNSLQGNWDDQPYDHSQGLSVPMPLCDLYTLILISNISHFISISAKLMCIFKTSMALKQMREEGLSGMK